MSDVPGALQEFDALFDRAWCLTSEAEARLRESRPGRARDLRGVLRHLHRVRGSALHGDARPGAPGGGLGLAAMAGRGLALDGDLPEVSDALRALGAAFDDGLGLVWDGPDGRPAGWAEAVQQRPPTPAPPPPEDEPAPPRRRWGWRGGR